MRQFAKQKNGFLMPNNAKMDAFAKVYNHLVYQIFYERSTGNSDGNHIGSGLVVALRPPFKRFNSSLRRGGSQRIPRPRPASLLAPSSDLSANSKSEENGPANNKCNSSEGPAGWATSFEKLLDDPLGLHTFAEFLKKEFSAENIYFWTACERYRRLPESGPERAAEAQRIYQQHLCVGAPEPVNVDAQGRQCTEQSLRDARTGLFDQAQKQIFNLMKFDSYPRFLKSDLYRQCLNGGGELGYGSHLQLDAGLLLQPPNSSTPSSKLKKSLSNAEDRRRKSLLPWHRKNRSKSKDRGEIEYSNGGQHNHQHNHHSRKNDAIMASNESVDGVGQGCGGGGGKSGSDIHSSKSSLTSLDLASCTSNNDFIRGTTPDELSAAGKTALCRVILSNGSTTVVQIKQEETIHQLVSRLLEKRGLLYSSFEVFTDKQPKALDVNEPSTRLTGCEVTVEQRVVFKMDLPNKKVISVKSKYTKIIVDVLGPILQKYNYSLDQARVTLADQDQPVDVYLPVTSIDGARLRVHYGDAPPIIKVNNMRVNKLEEITNQVFEGILQEKADSAAFLKPSRSDKGSVKSEDWGSEHSSGIFGRFLRRDSGLHEAKKKKSLIPRAKPHHSSSVEDVAGMPPPQQQPPQEHQQAKKPLIAKLKTGVNKLQVTACSESDELVEGLTRAQRSRLEDQRGTEINFELPDFLKDKHRKPHDAARFYLAEGSSCGGVGDPRRTTPTKSLKLESRCNYENRNVKDMNNLSAGGGGSGGGSKVNNLRIYSPNKLQPEESPTKGAVTPKSGEPPPLPPKPKIIPIKPPNWGQNGFYRKEAPTTQSTSEKSKTLYLEQPSSSFV